MRSGFFPVLAVVLIAACGGSTVAIAEEEIAQRGSSLANGVVYVPLSLQLCAEPSEESLAGALGAGFEPQFDVDGALVSIGVVVSGSADEEALLAIEAADCVLSLERADERIIETPEAL